MVNATYKLAPWADVLYAADHQFWKVYRGDIFQKFKGELWTVSEQSREMFGLYWIHHDTSNGYSKQADSITGGGNSGHQALHLAALFGAKKIILIGYDMQRTGGKEHWHGKHEGGLHNGAGFVNWIHRMKYLADDLAEMGVEVINASRVSALKCFPRATIEEVL